MTYYYAVINSKGIVTDVVKETKEINDLRRFERSFNGFESAPKTKKTSPFLYGL